MKPHPTGGSLNQPSSADNSSGIREQQQAAGTRLSRGRSRESRPSNAGMLGGDVIQVDMAELANVLGYGLDELLQSLRKEATSEAEGVAVEPPKGIDSASLLYPPPRIKQALVTTISRRRSVEVDDDELPRMLWVLGGAGGKTIIELVLLTLMRGGIERVVIVIDSETGDQMKEAVARSVAEGKMEIEFVEDCTDRSRQFHAKSILRARNCFASPFLLVTADRLFHPGLLHLLAAQDLDEDEGCVLVEDVAGPEALKNTAPTAVFVRRGAATPGKGEDTTSPIETQESRKVMAIGRREQGRGQRWDGIECGALVMSTEIFDTLSILSRRRRNFTLADALDIFAGQGLLSSVTTEGKPWLALESKSQLQEQGEGLVQQLINDSDFPLDTQPAPKLGEPGDRSSGPSALSTAEAAAAVASAEAMGDSAGPLPRMLSLHLDPAAQEEHNEEDNEKGADFKGFIVPVEAGADGVGTAATATDEFLERGPTVTRRVTLEHGILQMGEPDVEAGQGAGAGGATVTLPWAAGAAGDIGYIVSVPGEDGGEELVFAVPELQHRHQPSSGCGGGGLLGLDACCGGGNICCGGAADSGDEGGGMDDDSGDEMDDYNCLGGGMLNACLPEMPSEMPSDIQSVRVTTDLVVEKEGEEPTLAVHIIVDKRVPVLGWILMVSALFGLAAMGPTGDLLSQMSPDTAPAVYPVWRYSCSSILYAPWFLLMVAGSKSARAELRDWSVMLPIVIAGVGLAGWGLCFYTALNFADASMVALLASLTPMCLVVWRGVTGEAVHRLEIIGVLLALAGGVVSTIGEGGGDNGADAEAGDTAAKAIAVAGAESVPDSKGTGEQAFGIALALLSACWGGVYIINAKAARSKVEVSHFAFVASVVPAIVCATVLVASCTGSASGREMLFGPAGLLGWTQTPGLALTQILTSLLGDVIGNFGFYLLLKYISPLVASLAGLTVPLLAVFEGLMLGVVTPPGILFGVGAGLILGGAGMASLVTMLPHTEVFDATKAVKLANETEGMSVVDPSPGIGGPHKNSASERYGAVSGGSSFGRGKAGGAVDEMLPWEKNGVGAGGADGEKRPLIDDDGLSATAEDKKSPGSYGSWMPRLFK